MVTRCISKMTLGCKGRLVFEIPGFLNQLPHVQAPEANEKLSHELQGRNDEAVES